MTHCCSQCNFTANFESALLMHKQLHHERTDKKYQESKLIDIPDKAKTMPPLSTQASSIPIFKSKRTKSVISLAHSSSATRLFEKLRSRICKSRTSDLVSHPEEPYDPVRDLTGMTSVDDSSKASKQVIHQLATGVHSVTPLSTKESFGCHLCPFEADRITVLDRHLLNDHKIGLDNLLKLVMAKTKDGLSEKSPEYSLYNIREPYYKPSHEMIEDGEFVVETITPKIKILKHASTNTEISWNALPEINDDCKIITKEIEDMIKNKNPLDNKEEFIAKMQMLNEYMSKFVDSSNAIKKVLSTESSTKHDVSREFDFNKTLFDLNLRGDDTPRDSDKAHSVEIARRRHKFREDSKSDKKYSTDSFYF